MKKEKQLLVLSLFNSGRYKLIADKVYSLKSSGWIELIPNTIPAGYKQIRLTNHKRGCNKIVAIVYLHILVYLVNNGVYDDSLLIDHIDDNPSNNLPNNLAAVTKSDNINSGKASQTKDKIGWINKPIRAKEIAQIKELMAIGYSQAKIAKELGLNRLSVRYTYNNIINGNKLKYE